MKSRFQKGDRIVFNASGRYYDQRGTVEHVRKDGKLLVHPDSEPEGALLIVYPSDVAKTSGDPRRRRQHRRDCIGVHTHENMGRRMRMRDASRRSRLTRSQQEYVHRKIRILRREHPRWSQKQVVAVAYSYARAAGAVGWNFYRLVPRYHTPRQHETETEGDRSRRRRRYRR